MEAREDVRRSGPGAARVVAAVALAGLAAWPSASRGDDEALARSLVEKADQVRFPGGGFEVAVTIATTAPSRDPETTPSLVDSTRAPPINLSRSTSGNSSIP